MYVWGLVPGPLSLEPKSYGTVHDLIPIRSLILDRTCFKAQAGLKYNDKPILP